MKKETSAGVIVYSVKGNHILFLLLLKGKRYWSFPKGLVEPGESLEQTALRETEEETGIKKVKILDGFSNLQKWVYRWNGNLISKEATFYIGRVEESEIEKTEISHEHDEFKWVGYEDALKLLNIKDNKKMLGEAYSFIQEKEKRL